MLRKGHFDFDYLTNMRCGGDVNSNDYLGTRTPHLFWLHGQTKSMFDCPLTATLLRLNVKY